MLLSAFPFAAGTFFPFSWRPPTYGPPRYGYRSQRSPPNNNLVPVESPVLGLRVLVPRALIDLFNIRPTGPDYQRPNQFNPQNGFPSNGIPPNKLPSNGFPSSGFPPNRLPSNGFPLNGFSPNHSPPVGYPPNNFPQNGFFPQSPAPRLPPIDPDTLINLMRVLYPDLIYRPDPRLPNVFAIRSPHPPLPPTHLPGSRTFSPEFDQESENLPSQNQYNGELPSNAGEFSGQTYAPPNLHSQNYAQQNQPQQNQPQQSQPQNHLIIIR